MRTSETVSPRLECRAVRSSPTREDFDVLMGENGTRGCLFQLAHLAESGGILIGILERLFKCVDEGGIGLKRSSNASMKQV